MAGAIQPLMDTFKTPGNAAPGVAGKVLPGPRIHGYDEAALTAGPDTNYFMVQTLWDQHTGERQFSFLDDFYFRFYLIPSELAYGTFSQDTTINIRVWNAYFNDGSLTAVTPTFGTEVSYDGVVPVDFGALQIVTLPFTADGEGNTVLADQFTLIFDLGDILTLDVTGFRVPQLTDAVWEFRPNWSEQYAVQYEFRTDVTKSANGREQRIQYRQTPRRQYEFEIALTKYQRREYQRLMVGNQRGRFFIPEMTRYVTTAEVIPAQGIEAFIDGDIPWWLSEPNNYVILFDGENMSLRRIDFEGEDSNSVPVVRFKSDDEIEWPVGTKIFPALSCFIADDTSGSMLTNTVQTVNAKFFVRPGTPAIEPESTPLSTFDGRELWLEKPNWADPPETVDYHPSVFINFEVGRVDRIIDQDFQQQQLVLNYTGRDFAQSETLRQFFFRCAGMCREFYMPTWQYDIEAAQGWISGDAMIVVDGVEFAATYAGDPVRYGAGVALILHSGQIVYKQIADIFAEVDSNGEGQSIIQLTTTMGQDIELDEVEKICWVPLWRFATDTATFEFLTDEVCQVAFTVQTQPWQPKDGTDNSNSEIA